MMTVLNSVWTLLIHIKGKTRIDSVSASGRQLLLTYRLSVHPEPGWVEVEKKRAAGDTGDLFEQITE